MRLYNGDCFDIMPSIETHSVDLILCDLPYGLTPCAWDHAISLPKLWVEYKRILKEKGVVLLFGSQPFTAQLIQSNLEMFKYEWIYEKIAGSNFVNARKMPLKEHENVCVFYSKQPKYYPQLQERSEGGKKRLKTPYKSNSQTACEVFGNISRNVAGRDYDKNLRLPGSVQKFNNRAKGSRGLHPTQKPVELCEYFIKTYTDAGDTVMDNCMGSGTTGVACKNLNRHFIGIEKDDKFFQVAERRINGGLNNADGR